MRMSSNYLEVTVSVVNGQIVCAPDPGSCYWVTGPANVRWTFASSPLTATLVRVVWKAASPFSGQKQPSGPLGPVETFGNLQTAGSFGYRVEYLDARGRVVLANDPIIRNTDRP
jgi:hypothetical protein